MPINQGRFLWVMLTCLLLSSCDNGVNYAPVSDVSATEPVPKSGVHRVVHGESLYEIAWRYGLDYRTVASENNMTSPYILHTGQRISLRGAKSYTPTLPIKKSHIPVRRLKEPAGIMAEQASSVWQWPATGRILDTYSMTNKGIDISGTEGMPILASQSGEVVYSGSGLRGYGNLIILKHNSTYLSAYAHNKVILVKEGQWVRQGQKIAEMGATGTDKTMLHFEIREAGLPVNPLSLLTSPH